MAERVGARCPFVGARRSKVGERAATPNTLGNWQSWMPRLSRRSFADIDGISLTDGLWRKIRKGARFDPRTEFGQRHPQ